MFALVSLMTAPLAAAPASQSSPQGQPPQPMTGQGLYAQNCAPCHGETGRGDGPSASGLGVPPTAFATYDAVAGKSLAELFEITKNGNMQRMMPPWKNRLNDQQIWDAVGYAWTLHTSRAEIEAGKAIYDQQCASCHGPAGKGNPPAQDLTDFTRTSAVSQKAWADILTQGRNTMPAFSGKLAAADQRAVLEYVRSLSLGPLFRGPLPTGTGVISGTVTNQSTGQPLANTEVELGIFDQSSLLDTRKTTTDAAGFYRFGDLPAEDTTLIFLTRVSYPATAGNSYNSEPVQFQQDQAALDLPIAVYETTTDGSGVRADRVHIIVEFEGDRAYVAEMIVFSQDGKQAYVGDGSGVLRFNLPQGAENLDISDGLLGERYLPIQGGFVDTLPLPPGTGVRQVLYRYEVPYSGNALDLVSVLPYPVANVNALVADVGAQVASDQLQDQGVRQTQGGGFISLLGQNLPANQPITLRFTNLPLGVTVGASGAENPAPATNDRALLLIFIGGGGLLAALLVALPLLRQRSAAVTAGTAIAADRDSLIDALARLDIAYQAGELSETAYRDQRLRVKAQLLDIIRKEGGV
jgi:mono/diheme cytochrome c family protein